MARAHSGTTAQMHAANLALCEEGPARAMSKAELRLHALNKYKAKRRVSRLCSRPVAASICMGTQVFACSL